MEVEGRESLEVRPLSPPAWVWWMEEVEVVAEMSSLWWRMVAGLVLSVPAGQTGARAGRDVCIEYQPDGDWSSLLSAHSPSGINTKNTKLLKVIPEFLSKFLFRRLFLSLQMCQAI